MKTFKTVLSLLVAGYALAATSAQAQSFTPPSFVGVGGSSAFYPDSSFGSFLPTQPNPATTLTIIFKVNCHATTGAQNPLWSVSCAGTYTVPAVGSLKAVSGGISKAYTIPHKLGTNKITSSAEVIQFQADAALGIKPTLASIINAQIERAKPAGIKTIVFKGNDDGYFIPLTMPGSQPVYRKTSLGGLAGLYVPLAL